MCPPDDIDDFAKDFDLEGFEPEVIEPDAAPPDAAAPGASSAPNGSFKVGDWVQAEIQGVLTAVSQIEQIYTHQDGQLWGMIKDPEGNFTGIALRHLQHAAAPGTKANGKDNGPQASGQGSSQQPQPPPRPHPYRGGGRKGRDPSDASPDDTLEIVCAADIAPCAIEWLWPMRFARGKLGVIGGLPDRGKGLITMDVIARITNGDLWPCQEVDRAPIGDVLLLTAEDAEADTVIPRLMAAGADRKRVHIVRMTKKADGGKRMFSLITDLPTLEKEIKSIKDKGGEVVLIVIDPISAYLGVNKMDSYRTSDVRGVLSPLVALAEKHQCAIIGVMHFNKKEGTSSAMLRLSDSLAFVAAPRHAYVAIEQPDNPGTRLFAKAKNNLAPDDSQTLAYSIVEKFVGYDERSGKPIMQPHVVWQGEVEISADEALQATRGKDDEERAQHRSNAKDWLQEYLKDTQRSTDDIYNDGAKEGFSESTIKRAARDLEIVKMASGKGSGKLWSMPTKPESAKRPN
jgi:hypothetical protein